MQDIFEEMTCDLFFGKYIANCLAEVPDPSGGELGWRNRWCMTV